MDNTDHPEPPPLPVAVTPPPAFADPLPPYPAAPSEPHPHHLPPFGFTLRRFAHILTLFFCLFLVVRTTFVEPFGVTTGSMADTIHGNRREAPCPRCGAPLCVGSPDEKRSDRPQEDVTCANCGLRHIDLTRLAPETFGDRLMVDKLVYHLRKPRRWEAAVFHCPVDDKKPYVKRVVGLPGEAIRVFDGDVYTDGRLQRKTLDQVREVRIPVFRMDYPPAPDGWALRWEVGAVPAMGGQRPPSPLPLPEVSEVVQDTRLVIDATARPVGLTYRHRDLDAKKNDKDDVVRDRIQYNGSLRREWVPVHDFVLDCEIEVVSGEGTFACRLGDGADTVKADVSIHRDRRAAPTTVTHEGGGSVTAEPVSLIPGKRHRIEFAFVDRRVMLAIDGKEVIAPLDLPQTVAKTPGDPAGKRKGLDRPLQLGVSGASVVIHHLTLFRDIHYRSEDGGRNATHEQYRLGPDEYFMLGDNTANSQDSREWAIPGVPERDFLGKPFLIHQPLKAATLPVLGRVQTVDWDRFRLIE